MKIAFYMEDGVEQVVLTPQTKIEQEMLNKLHDGDRELAVHRGGFYECRGGWYRHEPYYSDAEHQYERSTILVLRPKPPQAEPEHSAAPITPNPPSEGSH